MSKSEGTAPPQKRTPASDERFHLSNRLLFRLFKTANIMHTAGTKWTSELKMTSQQWSVVGALARPGYEEGVSVNELSKFLYDSQSNVEANYEEEIRISPNPTNGFVNISSNANYSERASL